MILWEWGVYYKDIRSGVLRKNCTVSEEGLSLQSSDRLSHVSCSVLLFYSFPVSSLRSYAQLSFILFITLSTSFLPVISLHTHLWPPALYLSFLVKSLAFTIYFIFSIEKTKNSDWLNLFLPEQSLQVGQNVTNVHFTPKTSNF